MITAGCAVPAVQVSQDSSSTESAPSAIASASPTPSAPTATTSPSIQPTPALAPALAFEAPDDTLPPASIVVVVVDVLQLRGGPGLSAAVVGTAPRGTHFYLLHVFGPVLADGLDWYRLTTAGDSVLWAAAGSGADRYLEVVPPECPAGEPDLATLVSMLNDWDRLSCFGDRSLTVEGTYGCPGMCGPMIAGDFQPTWLTFPFSDHQLMLDYPSSPEYLEMRVPPEALPDVPVEGSIVRVTGHFNDPASTSCSMSIFDDGQAIEVDPRTAELYCRERFVVDAFEVIGNHPDFP